MLNHPSRRWPYLTIGLLALALAVSSPLESAASERASAHMVQHLLLIVLAAPALARAEMGRAMVELLPLSMQRRLGRLRHGRAEPVISSLRNPLLVWLVNVGVLVFWHAPGPYQAALTSSLIHSVEHLSFLLSAFWFWHFIVIRGGRTHLSGVGVLLVFGLGMVSVFLALLMTFATTPWYHRYVVTGALLGIDALADQHLAGAIMWVPAGLIYSVLGVAGLVSWLGAIERRSVRAEPSGIVKRT